jgi:hypothetical protein
MTRRWQPDEDYDDRDRWLDGEDGGDRWRNYAACRDDNNPDRFFPVDAHGNEPPIAPPEVREICNRCPVAGRCLERYMDEDQGVFGGTTGYQRRQLTRKIVRRQCVRCGSDGLVKNNQQTKEACLGCGLSWDIL